jgi:hypothetical protein
MSVIVNTGDRMMSVDHATRQERGEVQRAWDGDAEGGKNPSHDDPQGIL